MAEMSKSPEEIKKGLECCYSPVDPMLRCEACPYYGSIVCKMRLHTDALAYIQRLEAENAELVRKTEQLQSSMGQVAKALQDNGFQTLDELLQAYSQVKQERDAAVKDMKKMASSRDGVRCSVCRYRKAGSLGPCERCIISDSWEWRGVQEKEENNG